MGIERLRQLVESAGDSKPSFFQGTKYRLPTDEELAEIAGHPELSANDIRCGFGYAIIGRGMRGAGPTNEQMRKAHSLLVAKYPGNLVYKEAEELNRKSEEEWRERMRRDD